MYVGNTLPAKHPIEIFICLQTTYSQNYLLFTVLFVFPNVAQSQILLLGNTHRERADLIVAQTAKAPFSSSGEIKSQFAYVAARLFTKTDTVHDIKQLNTMVERFIAGAAYDNFASFSLMHTYMLCKNSIPDSIKLKIKKYMSGLELINSGYGTFNLSLMTYTSGYLAAQEWSDFKDKNGKTAIQILDYSSAQIVRYCKIIYHEGGGEPDAPTYFPIDVGPVRMIANFAKEEVLQRTARVTYQRIIAAIAGAYNQGLYVATPERSKGWSNLGDGLKKASSLGSLAWIYFGRPTDKFYFLPNREDNSASLFALVSIS